MNPSLHSSLESWLTSQILLGEIGNEFYIECHGEDCNEIKILAKKILTEILEKNDFFENSNTKEKIIIAFYPNEARKNLPDFDCSRLFVVCKDNERKLTSDLYKILKGKKNTYITTEKSEQVINYKGNGNPSLSFTVAIYNVEQYLEQCLASLSKNFEFIEVLMVDDGSTDNSGEIARQFAKRDQRFKYLKKENGGCASARNFGIKHSTGDYITVIDGDDFISDDFAEALLSAAICANADIAQAKFANYYNTTGQSIEADESWLWDQAKDCKICESKKLLPLQPTVWRRIYRKETLERNSIKFNEALPRFDDQPFQFKALAIANSVILSKDGCYFYRQEREGQDVSISDKRLFVQFDIFRELHEFVINNPDMKLDRYFRRVFDNTNEWIAQKIDPSLRAQYLSECKKAKKKFWL